jgi:hypothetical protein
MLKKVLYTIAIIELSIFLTACGNGSNNGNNENNSTNNSISQKIGIGHYIDSPVEGVNYNCGDLNGTTDNNGTFKFEKGKGCIFTLSNIVLRELNASQLENTTDIIENNITTARLLQTLDNDGNASNGIEITKNVLDIISENNFTAIPVGDDELSVFFDDIQGAEGYQGAMVTINQAYNHISETIKNLGLNELLEDIPTEEDFEDNGSIGSIFEGL